ncbi:MAG: hypothetical protein QOE59_4258 [Actinomycetota bacterium]|nr:hypothetical protein [Actinomycetota bacterium]
MTTTRDGELSSASEVGEASAFPGLQGMRWWAVLVLALVLTAGGVAADVLRAGSLGGIFLAAYPGGCVLATLLVRRRDLFVPMVQPPLLLAVSVPVAVAATGSLPASGGLVSTALAVGAPLINGFPAMAVTTVVCVLIGVIRIRVQRWQRVRDEGATRREPVRAAPSGGAARGRDAAAARDRPTVKRDDRDRRESAATDREQAERDRRRAQERARAQAERERADRARERPERPERDRPRREPARTDGGAERRPAAQRSSPPPERTTEKGPARPATTAAPGAGPRDARSREDRMREERLREERQREGRGPGPKPPGVHPVRERPPGEPPR